VTAAEALKDKHLVASIAAKARIDARTVTGALHGRKGKGIAYEIALKAIAESGIVLSVK
jgi:hypothetical protein